LRRSFGEAYRSDDPVLNLQLSGGPVGCAAETSVIVAALQGTSVLHGYRASGAREWVVQVEDYTPVPVKKDGGTTRYGSGATQPEDVTRRVTPLPTGEVLIQVIHRTPETLEGPRPWAHVNTHLLSPTTGRGVYVGTHLPLILEASGNRLYGRRSFPYPHVEIYEFDRTSP